MCTAQQVRAAAATVKPSSAEGSFIWQKLVERQRRWYAHDARMSLQRDECNRFVGTAANPFPFTQLDKLAERAFLDRFGVPQPRLLHSIPITDLRSELPKLAPRLPSSFVVKPVGAGHSFGVTVVRDGVNVSRGGVPFDAAAVADEFISMGNAGGCQHEGHFFLFNFSRVLIEECVLDELGLPTPSDYKIFVLGPSVLWVQLHFKTPDGLAWVAFVDREFNLLPQPAWDPTTCWRTHHALIVTEPRAVAPRKPRCWAEMMRQATRLGSHLQIFVRLDWYADSSRGPLMGEVTLFPHMLQPRTFYSTWANAMVQALWRGENGCAPVAPEEVPAPAPEMHALIDFATAEVDDSAGSRNRAGGVVESSGGVGRSSLVDGGELLLRTERILDDATVTLLSFMPRSDQPWARGADRSRPLQSISFGQLAAFVETFDLSPWGVPAGARVALLIANGLALAAVLLGTMSRYCAAPLDPAMPSSALAGEMRSRGALAVLVLCGTSESSRAHAAALITSVIELISCSGTFGVPSLPIPSLSAATQRHRVGGSQSNAPVRMGADELVLLLRTSGTTGRPKTVGFSLRRLLLAGAGIAASLELSEIDLGLAMLPLHHVGGISCNLIAPLVSASAMHFAKAFDSGALFGALAEGISWVYLVPTLWSLVLQYATEHPALQQERPWRRLRLVRNAGSALPHGVALALATLFGEGVAVLPTYGMTEAMPIAAPPVNYRLQKPGSVGRPLAGITIKIASPVDESAVPTGSIGEICVSGPTVLPHYEHDLDGLSDAAVDSRPGGIMMSIVPSRPSEYSRESFLSCGGFFRTGDLGRFGDDGWLYITGRCKEAINRGGETIAPGEVEEVLAVCPGAIAAEIMVFAAPHKQLGDTVAVAATSAVGRRVGLTQLRTFASNKLPASMLPQLLVLIGDSLPRGSSGKLLRTQLSHQMRAVLPAINLNALHVYQLESFASAPVLLETWGSSSRITGVALEAVSGGIRGPCTAGTSDAAADEADATASDSLLEQICAAASEFVQGPVAADTNLVEAGINSLAGIELAERLSVRVGLTLPSSLLSDHSTPASILACVRSLQAERGDQCHSFASASVQRQETSNIDTQVAERALETIPRGALPHGSPSPTTGGPLRVLMLHGEAADAALMELSLRATGWTDNDVASQLRFIFVDAPFKCAAQPRFHRGAVAAGAYEKAEYCSWGATESSTLEASLSAVFGALDTHAPIHGIGGICDGGLIAALVAAQRPSLIYLNFCSSPFARLPASFKPPLSIACTASVHLLSPTDELWSYSDLLRLPAACERATVLQHSRGHAVPPLRGALKGDVLAALGTRTHRFDEDASVPGQDDQAEVEAFDSLLAMAQDSRSRASGTHDAVMGHLMFLVVFNVMACHYGDWLGPAVSSGKGMHPIKVVMWSRPGLLEQGMPYWPLLQPLGREDSGMGIAMSLAFLVAGRNDALPTASMQSFFRARVVASVLIAATLLYVVQVLHYTWYPVRLLGRGPVYHQVGHRYWPTFAIKAASMGRDEQLLNMFARTWQLTWFLVLLVLFRLLRLFAIGCGIKPRWLALVALAIACAPHRQPYNISDIGALVHGSCVSVLCVPQVKQASRFLVAYAAAPWLVGGHDWRPTIVDSAPCCAGSQRAFKAAVLTWCAVAWAMLVRAFSITSHRTHDLVDARIAATNGDKVAARCLESPDRHCCAALANDFSEGSLHVTWRLLKYNEDAFFVTLATFLCILASARPAVAAIRQLINSSWWTALGKGLNLPATFCASLVQTAVREGPPTTLLAVLACISPWFLPSVSVDDVLSPHNNNAVGTPLSGWWPTRADGEEMIGRLMAITVRCCVMLGWVKVVPRGGSLFSRSGANSLLPYLLQHVIQNQYMVPPLKSALQWSANVWPLVLPTATFAAEVIAVQLMFGLGVPLIFRLLIRILRLPCDAAAKVTAHDISFARKLQRAWFGPQQSIPEAHDFKQSSVGPVNVLLQQARQHARFTLHTLRSSCQSLLWSTLRFSFVLACAALFFQWWMTPPASMVVAAGVVQGQPSWEALNKTLAYKLRRACPEIVRQASPSVREPSVEASRWPPSPPRSQPPLVQEWSPPHPGKNCYSPAAMDVEAQTAAQKMQPTVDACRELCEVTLGCDGVTVRRRPMPGAPRESLSCWLRARIHINDCAHDRSYQTHVLHSTVDGSSGMQQLHSQSTRRPPLRPMLELPSAKPRKVQCVKRCPLTWTDAKKPGALTCAACEAAYASNATLSTAACTFNVTYNEQPDVPSTRHLESTFSIFLNCGSRPGITRAHVVAEQRYWYNKTVQVARQAAVVLAEQRVMSGRSASQLIFIGDSIVHQMSKTDTRLGLRLGGGKQAITDVFGSFWPSPVLLGIPTDQTQHLLWRLAHDEIPHSLTSNRHALMVLMIGTNNLAFGQSVAETHRGVMACVYDLLSRTVGKLLVVGLLPRFDNPWNAPGTVLLPLQHDVTLFSNAKYPYLSIIADVNARLRASVHAMAAQLKQTSGSGHRLAFVDCGHALGRNASAGNSDDRKQQEMQRDGLHLRDAGYRSLAHCIKQPLHQLDAI